MYDHLSWIERVNTLENELSKSLGLLFKVKPFQSKCQGNAKSLLLPFL